MDNSDPSVPAQDIAALRPVLLRFAKLQLRNDAVAEDVVSETLLALIEKPAAYAAQSSLRTFATGVLKHKIVDHLRRGGREVSIGSDADESESDAIDALFAADGHWKAPPSTWDRPEDNLSRQQFFEVLQTCIDRLPAASARMFMMREWLELETEEICRELGTTANNAFVVLYRARMRLRECLQLNWFGDRSTEQSR